MPEEALKLKFQHLAAKIHEFKKILMRANQAKVLKVRVPMNLKNTLALMTKANFRVLVFGAKIQNIKKMIINQYRGKILGLEVE